MPLNMPERGRRRAFTLIELLTVIGIIIILMGILIPVIATVRRKAQEADTRAWMNTIAIGCQTYFHDFRAYPGPLPDASIHGFNQILSVAGGSNEGPTTASNQGIALSTLLYTTATMSNGQMMAFNDVTASENLLLGLVGGLVSDGTVSPPIRYDATRVPNGPAGLNPAAPQQTPAYINPKPQDMTDDGVGGYISRAICAKISAAGVPAPVPSPASTYVIPEFLDHFSTPNPIIYLRARTGAQFACDIPFGPATTGGNGSQYYSAEMDPYALNFFSQPDPGNNFSTRYGSYTGTPVAGAFFASQSQSIGTSGGGASLTRSQDMFILISAGYDGLYGTNDDIYQDSN